MVSSILAQAGVSAEEFRADRREAHHRDDESIVGFPVSDARGRLQTGSAPLAHGPRVPLAAAALVLMGRYSSRWTAPPLRATAIGCFVFMVTALARVFPSTTSRRDSARLRA